ncbi:sigma-70 family RNA polymerase sigma factor [Wenyingzhuangia sp. IMCC45574]
MSTQDIWNLYANDLKTFILSKTHDTTIAEDLLQDVFIKVHTKKEFLEKEESIKSWLFSIANRTVLDYFRSEAKKITDTDNTATNTFNDSENHHAVDCILPLILRLPKKYKEVLLLTTVKGLKHTQVANQLKISLPATKSRILRGKELLKQGFMDCCNYTLDENGHLKGEHKNIDECKVCRPQP